MPIDISAHSAQRQASREPRPLPCGGPSALTLAALTLSAYLLCALTHPSTARAQDAPTERLTPPLSRTFSAGELTVSGLSVVGLLTLSLFGEEWIGPTAPSMGPPAEGSTDARLSRWSSPQFDPSAQWLGGVPDLMGYAAPALALTYYVGGAALSQLAGVGDARPHEALAFSEGLSWAMFGTTLLKHLVGRERPYVVRAQRGELPLESVNMSASERLISFPSGHSTAIAATTFFVAADMSDALVTGPLRGAHPATRALVGRALPYLMAGATSWLVMYSRIKDQRHWLSDTLTGAAIGALSALLSYHMHFDAQGEPYQR